MDDLSELILNGFIIFSENSKFIVKKSAVPNNPAVFKEIIFDSYSDAIKAASEMLRTPQTFRWNSIVRYNRGLGIEYRNIPEVWAFTIEEAKISAERKATKILGEEAIILEIRTTLKIEPKEQIQITKDFYGS